MEAAASGMIFRPGWIIWLRIMWLMVGAKGVQTLGVKHVYVYMCNPQDSRSMLPGYRRKFRRLSNYLKWSQFGRIFFVFSGGKKPVFSQVGFEKINPRIFFLEEKHAWKKTWKKRKRMKGVACVFPPVAGDVLENFPPRSFMDRWTKHLGNVGPGPVDLKIFGGVFSSSKICQQKILEKISPSVMFDRIFSWSEINNSLGSSSSVLGILATQSWKGGNSWLSRQLLVRLMKWIAPTYPQKTLANKGLYGNLTQNVMILVVTVTG